MVCLLLDFLQLIQSHCFKSPYCGSIAWYLINKSEPLNLIYSNKCQQIVLHSQHKKSRNQTFWAVVLKSFLRILWTCTVRYDILCMDVLQTFLHAISIFVIISHLCTRESWRWNQKGEKKSLSTRRHCLMRKKCGCKYLKFIFQWIFLFLWTSSLL